jgi:hypothetical protein
MLVNLPKMFVNIIHLPASTFVYYKRRKVMSSLRLKMNILRHTCLERSSALSRVFTESPPCSCSAFIQEKMKIV